MKRVAFIALGLFALACGGEPSHVGLEEPLRVPGAFFHEGSLPGIPPDQQPKDPAELDELSPRVPVLAPATGAVRPGQAGVALLGTATEDTYSIAIRLRDVSSGYWVKTVGGLTGVPNEREWDARLDFSPDIEPGRHVLEVVAIDGDGKAGPQNTFTLCVTRAVEHTRNACDPRVLPPASLITLSWDSDADVDLVVVTPDGVTEDATHPTTLKVKSGDTIDPAAPGMGLLSLDGNGACRRDGARRETLRWLTSPQRGEHLVYVKLFEPCGAPATHFKVEAYVRTAGDEEDTYGLGLIAEPRHGVLLAQGASGDADLGVFVTTIEFP